MGNLSWIVSHIWRLYSLARNLMLNKHTQWVPAALHNLCYAAASPANFIATQINMFYLGSQERCNGSDMMISNCRKHALCWLRWVTELFDFSDKKAKIIFWGENYRLHASLPVSILQYIDIVLLLSLVISRCYICLFLSYYWDDDREIYHCFSS